MEESQEAQPVGDVPEGANQHCPGTGAEEAGKAAACAGCPNQQICATAPKGPDPDLAAIAQRLQAVKHIVLVLSGKGGVGKSTFAAQLAWHLAHQDKQVGLLDIDICGPSMPRLMGLEGEEIHQSASGWSPVYVDDRLGVMSIGFMLPNPDDAVVWRGPRKNSLIKQFLKDVDWGELDYLVVDSPPGTSDEHISAVQFLKAAHVDGAIVLTTPQEVSLMDVRKELSFCHKVGLNVLGVVENMAELQVPLSSVRFSHQPTHSARTTTATSAASVFPNGETNSHACEEGSGAAESGGEDVTVRVLEALQQLFPGPLLLSTDMFHTGSGGGGEAMARTMGVPFLGRVPFDPSLGRAAEEGRSAAPERADADGGAGVGAGVGAGHEGGAAGIREKQKAEGLSPGPASLLRIFDKIVSAVEKSNCR
ncbi:hypothetical protein CLOM_g11009 [Closterium sp. NIES-68]|nr:hypothetical protein CLOM_g11009 [Closterium sp. NIES-68]GJP84209.1 hypothetical protein CLOP_g14296 [Closterium sp. NIES-67]